MNRILSHQWGCDIIYDSYHRIVLALMSPDPSSMQWRGSGHQFEYGSGMDKYFIQLNKRTKHQLAHP